MKNCIAPTRLAFAASLLCAAMGAAQAATPNVGVYVGAQLWNPLKPQDDAPATLTDSPVGLSGPMNSGWEKARTLMADLVPKALAEYDLGAGFRLYDVKFAAQPLGPITLARLNPLAQGDAAPLRLHWTIPHTTMSFALRTPQGVPGQLDPRFSVALDLDLAVAVALSDTPGRTLQVTEVRVAVPAAGVHFQGDNPTGDIAVALTSFLTELGTGRNLNSLLNYLLDDQNFADGQHDALAKVVPQLTRIDVAKMANDALGPVNQAIKVPAGYVHIGQWLKPQAGGAGQMLSLVFAPRNLPLPPANGHLAGHVDFGAGSGGAVAALPTACGPAGFSAIVAQVQTGPRPVVDVAPLRYGPEPLLTLNGVAFSGGAVDSAHRRCNYRIDGLVAGWPNRIDFVSPGTRAVSPSVPNPKDYWALAPEGWTPPVVPAPALASAVVGGVAPVKNLVATATAIGGSAVGALRDRQTEVVLVNNGDPATRPATSAERSLPAGERAWGATSVQGAETAAGKAAPAWGSRQAAPKGP